jgi:anti-sigma-K factor RskA
MTMNCDTVRDLAPAFVLGALTPEEERAVREHLAAGGEPHPELEGFGGVVQYLDETVELIEPPASLKERVFAAVAAEPQPRPSGAMADRSRTATARTSDELPGVPVAAPPFRRRAADLRAAEAVPPPAAVVSSRRRAGPWTWLLAIAAIAAIAGLVTWNLLLRSQLEAATTHDRAIAAVLDLAARPGSQTAILRGDGGQAPHGIAAVGSDGSVVLAMRDLQPTVGSEVYEVWAMAPEGSPVAIGGFQVGSDGTGTMATRLPPAAGLALALTREPRPGADQPTTPVVAQGVATAPP